MTKKIYVCDVDTDAELQVYANDKNQIYVQIETGSDYGGFACVVLDYETAMGLLKDLRAELKTISPK